jgi:U3 small nucleolar ribonucleoprotein protein IMP3
MVRKLKFHEQKLLKKVDFINWEVDNNLHEVKVMKRYCIQKREDYTMYNKLSREIREIVRRVKDLVKNDLFNHGQTKVNYLLLEYFFS